MNFHRTCESHFCELLLNPFGHANSNNSHRFAVAESAYRNMRDKIQDQCILITGESGAGKTEASKLIMKYIAAVSLSTEQVDRIKEQLLNSNPCLEGKANDGLKPRLFFFIVFRPMTQNISIWQRQDAKKR
jgi:hypothetical protein